MAESIVKPLEWSTSDRAPSLVGAYTICQEENDGGADTWFWEIFGTGEESAAAYQSVEAAKAAAQADYERRILSAIDTRALEDDAKREALEEAWSIAHRHIRRPRDAADRIAEAIRARILAQQPATPSEGGEG